VEVVRRCRSPGPLWKKTCSPQALGLGWKTKRSSQDVWPTQLEEWRHNYWGGENYRRRRLETMCTWVTMKRSVCLCASVCFLTGGWTYNPAVQVWQLNGLSPLTKVSQLRVFTFHFNKHSSIWIQHLPA
jgi:hypothetical protein